MRANEHLNLVGLKTVLVPYQKKHVTTYNEWMQSVELRELTASEPLTLEEEFEMQQSWLKDEDKCTFIILDRKAYEESNNDEVTSMVGDVNLFLSEVDGCRSAEIEIMIARPSCRGRGLGLEATLAMLSYGINFLNIVQFTAKIGFKNERSLVLFKKIGFVEESRSDVFQEVTLRLAVDEKLRAWLDERTKDTTVAERH